MKLLVVVGALLVGASCASIVPAQPRFVAVYEQRMAYCRIQVIRDTRTSACFIAFKCSRQPVAVVPSAPETCVP